MSGHQARTNKAAPALGQSRSRQPLGRVCFREATLPEARILLRCSDIFPKAARTIRYVPGLPSCGLGGSGLEATGVDSSPPGAERS
jgi:hypothetical protein